MTISNPKSPDFPAQVALITMKFPKNYYTISFNIDFFICIKKAFALLNPFNIPSSRLKREQQFTRKTRRSFHCSDWCWSTGCWKLLRYANELKASRNGVQFCTLSRAGSQVSAPLGLVWGELETDGFQGHDIG
jgi:hypothetical protein